MILNQLRQHEINLKPYLNTIMVYSISYVCQHTCSLVDLNNTTMIFIEFKPVFVVYTLYTVSREPNFRLDYPCQSVMLVESLPE